jgi:nicotinamide phosphoribosyltransferase
MLEQYPTGMVACVSDSYDIFTACDQFWGEELRQKVLLRDGTLVIRPDSGEVTETLGKVMDILWARFGGSVNSKGYKVLDPHVRVIQGDGINRESIRDILRYLEQLGYSADNIAFGSGGALLQKFDRDTASFAFKTSSITINGNERDVYKNPVGSTSKRSKPGRLALRRFMNWCETVRERETDKDFLETVFRNGVSVKQYGLEEIRKRAEESF